MLKRYGKIYFLILNKWRLNYLHNTFYILYNFPPTDEGIFFFVKVFLIWYIRIKGSWFQYVLQSFTTRHCGRSEKTFIFRDGIIRIWPWNRNLDVRDKSVYCCINTILLSQYVFFCDKTLSKLHSQTNIRDNAVSLNNKSHSW